MNPAFGACGITGFREFSTRMLADGHPSIGSRKNGASASKPRVVAHNVRLDYGSSRPIFATLARVSIPNLGTVAVARAYPECRVTIWMPRHGAATASISRIAHHAARRPGAAAFLRTLRRAWPPGFARRTRRREQGWPIAGGFAMIFR